MWSWLGKATEAQTQPRPSTPAGVSTTDSPSISRSSSQLSFRRGELNAPVVQLADRILAFVYGGSVHLSSICFPA